MSTNSLVCVLLFLSILWTILIFIPFNWEVNKILHERFIFAVCLSLRMGMSSAVTPADPCYFIFRLGFSRQRLSLFSRLELHGCTLKAAEASRHSPPACRHHFIQIITASHSGLPSAAESNTLKQFFEQAPSIVVYFLRDRNKFLFYNSHDFYSKIK